MAVKARLTDTPQFVATEVGPQRWEQMSRFRLTTVVPGMIDETADEDVEPETPAPLALPEGSAPA